MELALVAVSLVFSLAAAGVAIALFINRENLHDVIAKQRSIELELADVVDRLSVWQRRDASRARKLVGGTPDEQSGLFADQHGGGNGAAGKAALRVVARQRGLIR